MMKKISFIIILFLLGLSFHLFAATRGIRVIAKTGQSLYLYENYHALVVGVSNYEKWPRLPDAVNDAKEVAFRLKELGFEVKLVLDPTSREMKTVLNEMVYDMGIEENRAIIFYYAGHGETETLADRTKMGYILPRDCPILEKDPKGFANHAISMRDIESASMRIKSKHVLMLFDSCFSGSLFALVRAVPDDITEKSALPVRQYITAGREDEEVPDKSVFKRCFLIGLEGDADLTGDGYVAGSELGMYLSDKVVNYTHRRQHPQYGKINNPELDRGDFIFALKAPSQPSAQISAAPPPSLEAEKQRLAEERERQELERLKIEIERKKLEVERKRLAAEKEKLEMANITKLDWILLRIQAETFSQAIKWDDFGLISSISVYSTRRSSPIGMTFTVNKKQYLRMQKGILSKVFSNVVRGAYEIIKYSLPEINLRTDIYANFVLIGGTGIIAEFQDGKITFLNG